MYKHSVKRKSASRRSCGGRPYGARAWIALVAALCLGIFIGSTFGSEPKEDSEHEAASPTAATPKEAQIGSALKDLFVPAASDTPSPTSIPHKGGVIRLDSSVITVSVDGVPQTMELEEYLVGVVAAEMSVKSEPDALRAQAIAARTFTALHMNGSAKCPSGCTVCSDYRCCQAYKGTDVLKSAWGSRYDEYISKIRDAVSSTEGLVVTFDGQLISALYHASSGPATENSEEVFAVALPYLVSVESFEGDAEIVSVQEFSVEEVVKKINARYPEANMKAPLSPTDFDIWGRSDSGRVQLVRIGDSVISGSDLRMTLGLRSASFTVTFDENKVTFTCLGYGHGVGMSQVGANEMAKNGADYRTILAHFYTGTDISRLEYSS
ncbi:MAG: stage II sporulation protein D [Clostridia bacterium]|nr:stage II sporulation protein D [Clostridia bacterium]